ncbi:MAG: T9SS type A sorting domain-containing protein [Bacteroidetes bacterium]|nr:T9SS type A sorting domain-containing protein [Bacteroidota bacterium]
MKRFTRAFLMIFLSSVFFLFNSVNAQEILAVDRDGSAWTGDFTDCWPYYEAALDANGYSYTYFEVVDGANDGPDLATMQMYDIIIWFTGEVWSGSETMTDNDEANLASYLDGGGKLFFSGQDYLYDRFPSAGIFQSGEFPYDYLGLREVFQDFWGVFAPDLGMVDGVAGSLAEGYSFEVQDIFTSGREGLYIDEIIAHVGMDLFEVTSPAPSGMAAVQHEMRAFKTIFTTVSFAAISDPVVQADLLMDIVDWLYGGAVSCDPYFSDFDSYVVGDYLAVQDPCWTTWSNNPGSAEDALISDAQAFSGVNSVLVEGSSTDLIFGFGDKTEGMYSVSMYMYVEPGYGGYYNLLHEFTGERTEWALEVYFASDGTGYINAGGSNSATFTYPTGEWFMVETYIDLDGDWAEHYVDAQYVHGWQWSLEASGGQGLNQLGAMDIFAAAPAGDDPMFYFDDVNYQPAMPPSPCEDFDALTPGDFVALELGDPWTTWSNNPGSAEDATVTDVVSNSPDNSIVIQGSTDLVRLYNDENLTEGKWIASHYMLVADGNCGYFNLQKDIVPGVEWGFQVQFDVDGVATVDAGGAGAATFNFAFDTWIFNELIVDLDNDWAEYWVDGNLIVEWQWTLGTFGDPGALTLGGMNIYAWASAGNSPLAYFDDVCFDMMIDDGCDYFDDLTADDYLALQLGDPWTTWSNNPGSAEDAMVSDVVSFSPDNSFLVEGSTDLVRLFNDENYASGKFGFSLMMYVADGFCGYFNLQKDIVPGVEWGFQVQYDADGLATVDAGAAAAATFNFDFDTWIHNELIVDLNTDWAEYWVDGELVVEWQWTLGTFGDPGALTLGGANFYAWASAGNSPQAYFDDVCFEVIIPPVGISNPSTVSDESLVIFPNPAKDHLTITSVDPINEVRIFNNMGQEIDVLKADNKTISINTGNYATGLYIVQIWSGNEAVVRKLIIE